MYISWNFVPYCVVCVSSNVDVEETWTKKHEEDTHDKRQKKREEEYIESGEIK